LLTISYKIFMGKILVVGSLNMDMVVEVDEMPKIGQTIKGKNLEYIPGGKGANQAYAASKLGAKVSMIGAVGNDNNSVILLSNLERAGIDISGISIINKQTTGVAFVVVNKQGDNQIIIIPGANAKVLPEMIDSKSGLIEKCRIILMQMEIPLETVIYTAALAKKNNKIMILNPAPAQDSLPDELLKNVDILTPNETELEMLTGDKVNDLDSDLNLGLESVVLASRKLIRQGVNNVIVTLGKHGAVLVTEDNFIHKKSYDLGTVVDTTAAGDCFSAALAVACLKNQSLEQSMKFANMAASISVTRKGAQPSLPSLSEVEKALDSIIKY
jgi:ribokinase